MAANETSKVAGQKTVKCLMLGASLATGNMGVSALVSGTVSSFIHSHPRGEVALLEYDDVPLMHTVHTAGGPVPVELINIRFSKKFFLPNNIARLLMAATVARFLPRGWREPMIRRNPYLQRIQQADYVVSIAGGDSFSDIYGLARLIYVALPQILVLQLRKPLILLPQTIGPFKGFLGRMIAAYIMRRADVVYSRDRTGFAEAETLMGSRKDRLHFSHDMAFVMEPAKPQGEKLAQLPVRDGQTPVVGLNVSGLLWMGGYDGKNMFGLKADYVHLTRELIDYFINEEKASVVLVPHVFGEGAECDTGVCAQLYKELQPRYDGRLFALRGDFNQHEIKYAIGQCDFFLGSRMHACIAALSQCVPAVCLAYSRKFVGVMDSIGCAELAVDMCELDTEGTMVAARKIFKDRERIRNSLQNRIPEIQKGVFGLFKRDQLKAFVGNFPTKMLHAQID